MDFTFWLRWLVYLVFILPSGPFAFGEVDTSNESEHSRMLTDAGDPYNNVPRLEIFPSFDDISSATADRTEETVEEIEEPEQETEVFSRKLQFLEVVSGKYGFTLRDRKRTVVKGKPESICIPRNRTENSTLEVELVNSTTLLSILGNKNESLGPCSVVLFFAPWCMFCARIAPYYNAVARAFPQMNVLAIDSIHFSSLNTRYGTIAVPNILVFYNNSKGVARFNHTERSFKTFVGFIRNVTGFVPDESVHVIPDDYEGPLKSAWTKNDDWLLWLSWVFIIVFSLLSSQSPMLGSG